MVVAELQELLAGELGAVVELGTPNRWMMSVKNNTACSDLMLVMARTSIHFENLSMATNKWVKPPGAGRKGPTRSNPQTAKGHVTGMVCRACAGRCVFRA